MTGTPTVRWLPLLSLAPSLSKQDEKSPHLMEDCERLAPILLGALKRTLLLKLKARDIVGYRALLNLQAVHMRGFSLQEKFDFLFESPGVSEFETPDVVQQFLHQNGFTNIGDVDTGGWSPLHYAAIRGDPVVVEGLLTLRADPNIKTRRAAGEMAERISPKQTPPNLTPPQNLGDVGGLS